LGIGSTIEDLGPVYSRIAVERLCRAISERLKSPDPQVRFWAEEQVNLLQEMLVEMVRVGYLSRSEAEKFTVLRWQREELGKIESEAEG
jgi:hypothetical protein